MEGPEGAWPLDQDAKVRIPLPNTTTLVGDLGVAALPFVWGHVVHPALLGVRSLRTAEAHQEHSARRVEN